MKWRRDEAVAIAGAALGLAALVAVPTQIRGQGYGAIADVQSPAFFPILIALLILAISILLMAARLRGPARPAREPQDHIARDDETASVEAPGRLAVTATCLTAYYVALSLVGMVAASVVLIAVLSLVLGYRRYVVLGAIALVLPVAIFLSFEKGLFVMLPAGRIF